MGLPSALNSSVSAEFLRTGNSTLNHLREPQPFLESFDERRYFPRHSGVRFLVHQEIPAASELEPIQDVPNTHGFDFSESSMVEAFTFRVAAENRL